MYKAASTAGSLQLLKSQMLAFPSLQAPLERVFNLQPFALRLPIGPSFPFQDPSPSQDLVKVEHLH